MNDHYYTRNPASRSDPKLFKWSFAGRDFEFETDHGVFSMGEADEGSVLLLQSLPEPMNGQVLDLGCGWGLIGITIAGTNPQTCVTMSDVNERAVMLAVRNSEKNDVQTHCVQGDGFESVQGNRFDWIITNPPIRAGKQVIYRMFADSTRFLTSSGRLVLVIRRQQGAESAEKYLKTIFHSVEIRTKKKGYWVIECRETVL